MRNIQTQPFPIQVGQTVYLIPLYNARFRFPRATRDEPQKATITKIGRIYMTVRAYNNVETRFRIEDFSSADLDDNASYELYESEETATMQLAKTRKIIELRNVVQNATAKQFDSFTLDELTSIVERLQRQP